MTYVLTFIGFVFLVKGADLLVNGASALARRMRVSSLIIGLTVVAFGTSTPELVVNLWASFQGNTGIAIGNIIGSNTANILLILGISAIVYPLVVASDVVWRQIPLSLLAAVVLGILANDILAGGAGHSTLTRGDGLILLAFFLLFMGYVVWQARNQRREGTEPEGTKSVSGKDLLYIVVGLAGLTLGAKWVVDGAVKIAEVLGISQQVIGLTIVAVGTSLPELATSIVAAYKRNSDIAVGNIVGSNIFNIFFILGISAVVRPLAFDSTSNIDLGVTVMASVLLFVAMFTGRKRHLLERWEGIIFVVLYAGYIAYLIVRA
jgi:cation:H+ antiporter